MAKKLESTLKNMSLSLFIICATMSAALGIVYILTKGPIEQAEKQKITEALRKVLPAFNNDPNAEMVQIDNMELYPAKMNGKVVGVAVKAITNKGYSGDVTIMAGFKPDGSIYNSEIISQKETPGLGAKMTEPKFRCQFNGKTPGTFKVSVKKDGGDVDAITAATISSRAFCTAILNAYNGFNKYITSKQETSKAPNNKGGIQ